MPRGDARGDGARGDGRGRLVLTIKHDELIVIGEGGSRVTLAVIQHNGRIRVRIEAPRSLAIRRVSSQETPT